MDAARVNQIRGELGKTTNVGPAAVDIRLKCSLALVSDGHALNAFLPNELDPAALDESCLASLASLDTDEPELDALVMGSNSRPSDPRDITAGDRMLFLSQRALSLVRHDDVTFSLQFLNGGGVDAAFGDNLDSCVEDGMRKAGLVR